MSYSTAVNIQQNQVDDWQRLQPPNIYVDKSSCDSQMVNGFPTMKTEVMNNSPNVNIDVENGCKEMDIVHGTFPEGENISGSPQFNTNDSVAPNLSTYAQVTNSHPSRRAFHRNIESHPPKKINPQCKNVK